MCKHTCTRIANTAWCPKRQHLKNQKWSRFQARLLWRGRDTISPSVDRQKSDLRWLECQARNYFEGKLRFKLSPGANFSPMLREVGLTRNHSSFLSDKSVRSTQFAPRKTKGRTRMSDPHCSCFWPTTNDRRPTTSRGLRPRELSTYRPCRRRVRPALELPSSLPATRRPGLPSSA